MNRYQVNNTIDHLLELNAQKHELQNEIHNLFIKSAEAQGNDNPTRCILYSWITEDHLSPKTMSNIYLYADKWIKKNAKQISYSHIEIEHDFIIETDHYEGFHKYGTKINIVGTPIKMIYSEEYINLKKSIQTTQQLIDEKDKEIILLKDRILRSVSA